MEERSGFTVDSMNALENRIQKRAKIKIFLSNDMEASTTKAKKKIEKIKEKK